MKKTKVSDFEEINEKNERALIDQSDLYKSKLVVEYERYEKLEAEYEKIREASVKKVEELENSIEKRIENIKREFDEKLSKYEDEVKLREKTNEEKMKSIEEVLKQTEEDADKEILEMKTKYEKDLKSERETLVKVRGELGIMKKKNLNVTKELNSHKEDIDWMGKEQARFKVEIKTSEKDKVDLKREIKVGLC